MSLLQDMDTALVRSFLARNVALRTSRLIRSCSTGIGTKLSTSIPLPVTHVSYSLASEVSWKHTLQFRFRMRRYKLAYELRCGREFCEGATSEMLECPVQNATLTFSSEVKQLWHRLSVRQSSTLHSQFVEELVTQGLGCTGKQAIRISQHTAGGITLKTYVSRAVGVYSRRLVIRAIASWGVRGRNTLLKGWGLI